MASFATSIATIDGSHAMQLLDTHSIMDNKSQIFSKPSIQLIITSKFNHSYHRVNKRTGKKNLRCFPECCATGHVANGFCGRPVSSIVRGINSSIKLDDFVAFGELTSSSDNDRYYVNHSIPIKEISNIERTKDNPNGEFIPANICRTQRVDEYLIEINNRLEAWHYPWNPARRASKLPHNIRVYLFQKKDNQLLCVGKIVSQDFRISCKKSNDNGETKEEEEDEQDEKLNCKKRNASKINDLDGSETVKKSRKNSKKNNEEDNLTCHANEVKNNDNQLTILSSNNDNSDKYTYDTDIDNDDYVTDLEEGEDPFPVVAQSRQLFLVNLLRALMSDLALGIENWNPKKGEDVIPDMLDSSGFEKGMKDCPGLTTFTTILLGEVLSGKEADFEEIYKNSENVDMIESDEYSNSSSSGVAKSAIQYSASLARDLSNFLQNDEIFTKQLSEFIKGCKDLQNHDSLVDEHFGKFFTIVIKHIEGFLATRDITLEKLEEKLSFGKTIQNNSSSHENLETKRQNQMQALKNEFLERTKKSPFAEVFEGDIPRLTEPEFDLEGTWLYIGEDTAANEVVNALNAKGFPGFLLHFFRKSMMKFHININRDWMYLKGPEKLSGDIQYLFSLDKNEHSWILPQFVPLASPVRSVKYVGWVDYEKRCIKIEQYGIYLGSKDHMLSVTREFRASPDRIEMYITSTFSLINETRDKKEILGVIDGVYMRIWKQGDASQVIGNSSMS